MAKDVSGNQLSRDDDAFLMLVRRARGGDADALRQLIEQCQPYLLTIANREMDGRFAAKMGASDLVQNAMMSAHRCLDDFEGESREELLGWLRGILMNDLKQAKRRYRAAARDINRERVGDQNSESQPALQIPGAEQTPSSAAIAKEEEDRLHRAVAQLAPLDQQVIQLRNWEELSFSEIGSRIGRTSEAARKLWSRAIVRLQRVLEEQSSG